MRFIALFWSLVVPALAFSDSPTGGWSFSVGCPGSGSSFRGGLFTSSNSSGFSGSGSCTRVPTRFTRFDFLEHSGGNLISPTFYGVHTGDVLIVPPVLTTETEPVFMVDPACPTSDKNLNFIWVQWGNSTFSLINTIVTGTASYSLTSGLAVTGRFEVRGRSIPTGHVPLPGSCSGGVYNPIGTGDRGGSVYFTSAGAGNFKTLAGHAAFFFPQYTIQPATDLGKNVFSGIFFDSIASSNTRQATLVSNPEGNEFTVKPYLDVEAGVIDPAFTDTISINAANYPSRGMMVGTVKRMGVGAGTGHIACIVYKALVTRLICSGESPNDNRYPYTIAFSLEGPQVLGQPTPMSVVQYERGLRNPAGSWGDGKQLILADAANHRVLIYKSAPRSATQTADIVVGQPGLMHVDANHGGLSPATLNHPQAVFSDGTRLFVADTLNHRVLVWNTLPAKNFTKADLVLGGNEVSSTKLGAASSMQGPTSVWSDGTMLLVADTQNHRVLGWRQIPSTSGTPADFVLGQPSLLSKVANSGGLSSKSLSGPSGVFKVGSQIFVSDSENHRVLVWNQTPAADFAAADLVLGQKDFVSNALRKADAFTFGFPQSVTSDGKQVFVTDSANSRVLIWNSLKLKSGQAADRVLGQVSMAGDRSGTSATSFYGVNHAFSDGYSLFVADYLNHRILGFASSAPDTGASADFVLGQPDFVSALVNSRGVNAQSLQAPRGIATDGKRLGVADSENHRVLIWNAMPAANGNGADILLGASDFTVQPPGSSADGEFQSPWSVALSGARVAVSDSGNHRVLIWNEVKENGQIPDVVLGAGSRGQKGGGNGKSILKTPAGIFWESDRLWVADSGNNRVVAWSKTPTQDGVDPDLRLGGLTSPHGVIAVGKRLIVADTGGHRVLIWNEVPQKSDAAADVVLGQADFASRTANVGGVSASTLRDPETIYSDGTRLFVLDRGNNRVLIWNQIPVKNQTPADAVFGQRDFISSSPNPGGLNADTVQDPFGLSGFGSLIFVGDTGNDRVVNFEIP